MASQLTLEQRHPEQFKRDQNIDRRHGTRTVPMQVMNLGFPRTGTMCKCTPPSSSLHLSNRVCRFDSNASCARHSRLHMLSLDFVLL